MVGSRIAGNYYLANNDFTKETYAQRVKGESSNDYNDRLIRKACKFYNSKGIPLKTKCLLLTNDRGNAKKGLLGIILFTLQQV